MSFFEQGNIIDPNYFLNVQAGNAILQWDFGDSLVYFRALNQLTLYIAGATVFDITGSRTAFANIPAVPSFTVATLPSAPANARGIIYVADGTTNKRQAISDGTNWRWPDGAIVS
jgi:hypothetical protein